MYYNYKKTCEQCGAEFRAQRYDAKYCSAACRKAASRRKEGIERTGNRIIEDLASLNRDRERYPDLAHLVDEIKRTILDYAAAGLEGETDKVS